MLVVHSCFIFLCSFIYCVYISLYFNVHIIVVGLYYCACFPRLVLDPSPRICMGSTRGGRNPIQLRHLGLYLFNLCHPIYFQAIPIPFYFMLSHLLSSNFHPLLIYVIPFTFTESSSPFILCNPFSFLHIPSPPLLYWAHAHTHTDIYIYIDTLLKKRFSIISLKWFLNFH